MAVLLHHECGTRRAQPLAELSPAERSEASAVNRALRARIRRKLEAIKQEAIQLPRLSGLGRRESVLSTYGILHMFCDVYVHIRLTKETPYCTARDPQQ